MKQIERAIEKELVKEIEQVQELAEALAEGDYAEASELVRELEHEHPGIFHPPYLPPIIPTLGPEPEPPEPEPCEETRILYASNNRGELLLIDSTTGDILDEIELPNGSSDATLRYVSAMNRLYLSSGNSARLDVFDTETDTFATYYDYGSPQGSIDIDSINNLLYIPLKNTNSVVVLDATSGNLIRTVDIPGSPFMVSVNPQSGYVYVIGNATSNNRGALWGMNEGDSVVTTLFNAVGSSDPWYYPFAFQGATADDVHHRLYMYEPNGMAVFDMTGGTTVVGSINHSTPVRSRMAIDPNNNMLYYSDSQRIYRATSASPFSSTDQYTLVDDTFAGFSMDFDADAATLYVGTSNGVIGIRLTDQTGEYAMFTPLDDAVVDVELGPMRCKK
jgi:hypothetical protein